MACAVINFETNMNSSHLRASVVGVGNTRYATMPELDAYDLGLWAL